MIEEVRKNFENELDKFKRIQKGYYKNLIQYTCNSTSYIKIVLL
jgi:hypothetical protein